MKHNLGITLLLLSLFFLTQVVGLFLIQHAVQGVVVDQQSGNIDIVYEDTAIGQRPQTTGVGSFLYLIIGVIVATLLFLLLIKYKKMLIWKVWYFFAVWLTTGVALGVVLSRWIALGIALLLAVFKLWKRNVITHNITEILIYAGIAVLLAPLFTIFWASMLLLAISLYDMYAVWKSKHMVKMAEFQTSQNLFAGLFVPAKRTGKVLPKPPADQPPKPVKQGKASSAVLGGGDLAFPLIFAGTVLAWLVKQAVPLSTAFALSLIISLFAGIALAILFFLAKKDRFYPAMPFISAGCFFGLGVVWLLL